MIEVALTSLAAFPQKLELCYSLFPQSMCNWRPSSWEGIPSEHLTAIEQICHVLDIERDGYQLRFRRMLDEDLPVLPDIAGEQLAIARQYAAANAEDVLREFRVARKATISLLSALSKDELLRTGVFEGVPISIGGLIHMLCSHDSQHLAGLHWLLGKMTGLSHEG
jgi:hypothetical protein